ncbi:MAG: GDP-mannose 4,6-dehydratase [Acidobacteria bacterium]|nr:GDP-mannose 4,6-dehydratase [Acidobacteriota bacterium]
MKCAGKDEMRAQDRFRSVLIFGGAGFIGSNLAHHLLESTDAKVHVFDNLSRPGVRHNLQALQRAARNPGRLQITVADVRDAAKVERAVRFATEIYHFAAQVAVTTSIDDPGLDFDVNLRGTFNILEAARRSGRRPFMLFTSTNKVYGELAGHHIVEGETRYSFAGTSGITEAQPLDFHSPYGCSKGAADQYVRDYARVYRLPTVVFRMSCIAGPRQFGNEDQGWVAHFLYSALENQPLVLYGDGRQVRDVLCVEDLLRAFEAVRRNVAVSAGEIYNVGGGVENSVSLIELIAMVEKLTGRPMEYAREDYRRGDQRIYITDYSRLARHTGWRAEVSVPATLEKIYSWWRRNRESLAAMFAPVPASSVRVFSRPIATLAIQQRPAS